MKKYICECTALLTGKLIQYEIWARGTWDAQQKCINMYGLTPFNTVEVEM